VDEMTGLQALERVAPDKPPQPNSVAKNEYEYERHGTTTLIGNWDVVAGQMIACTLGPRGPNQTLSCISLRPWQPTPT